MENIENKNRNLVNDFAVVNNRLKTARKEGLTKGIVISAIFSIIFLIISGVVVYSIYKKEHNIQLSLMETQRNEFTKEVTARDSVINDWLLTFDQIERDLNLVKQKENIINVMSSDQELSKNSRKDQILNDIKYINALLDSNKKKIASLTAQLKNSGSTITGLQTRIASLETTLKQYETDIADLKTVLVNKDFEISQLNTKTAALETTVSQKEAQITDQTNLMNQAYIAKGTYKELKAKGIVLKEGGFLGMGRKESLMKDLSDTLFAKIDQREIKMIPVNSKNARLITSHPSGSYEMIHESEKMISYIEIKDPEMFWKISKYAVVEIIQ